MCMHNRIFLFALAMLCCVHISAHAKNIPITPRCIDEAENWYIEVSYRYRNPAIDTRSVQITFSDMPDRPVQQTDNTTESSITVDGAPRPSKTDNTTESSITADGAPRPSKNNTARTSAAAPTTPSMPVSADTHTHILNATIKGGKYTLQFYRHHFSHPPTMVTVDDADQWFAISKAQCRPHRPFPTTDNPTTIPYINTATLTRLNDFLDYQERDFLIYRWNYFPHILIFDTKNYAVLGALFNRLAFFIEKEGHSGTVYTDAELVGRFAWNGHNYNAHDLVSFFNATHQQGIPLNKHEDELRDMLLRHNIMIRTGNGRYRAGGGGILGISQESSAYARQLILQHELLHGIFYSSEVYRNAVWDIWNALSPEEREGWRRVLTRLTYDAANEYIAVNEFQAYLLAKTQSQSVAQIGSIARTLSQRNLQIDQHAQTLVANKSASLSNSYMQLSHALLTHVGLRAGDLRTIR